MLYPNKLNRKKGEFIIKILIGVSIIIAVLLIIINKICTPQVRWAGLANAGIIYIWITVLYSINRNTNIAAHVLLQMVAISILTRYIDYKTGSKGWSYTYAIPIVIIIANITMFVLTIISHKKYIRYAIYQLLVCLFSILPIYIIYENLSKNLVMSYVAMGVSIVNLILTICLCARDLGDAIVRKFHV